MYTIILTFWGVMGLTTPTSYQVVIPNKSFTSETDCVVFGNNVTSKQRSVSYVCVKDSQ